MNGNSWIHAVATEWKNRHIKNNKQKHICRKWKVSLWKCDVMFFSAEIFGRRHWNGIRKRCDYAFTKCMRLAFHCWYRVGRPRWITCGKIHSPRMRCCSPDSVNQSIGFLVSITFNKIYSDVFRPSHVLPNPLAKSNFRIFCYNMLS